MRIYCLINPINSDVFYVGRTAGSLDKRLSAHIRLAVRGRGPNYTKNKIIRELISGNEKPIIEQLEYCKTSTESLFAEKFWIYQYETVFGYKLVNVVHTRAWLVQTQPYNSLLRKLIRKDRMAVFKLL